MLIKSNQMAAICFMIAVIAVTSPAIARSRAHHAGYHAHAQATGGDLGSDVMSVDRAADIRACNVKASRLVTIYLGRNAVASVQRLHV